MDNIAVKDFLPPVLAIEAIREAYAPLLTKPFHVARYETWVSQHIVKYADSLNVISVLAESSPEACDLEIVEDLAKMYKDLLHDAIEIIGTYPVQTETAGFSSPQYFNGEKIRNTVLTDLSYLYYKVSIDLEDVSVKQNFTNIDVSKIADLGTALFWYEVPVEILIKLSILVREITVAAEDYLYNANEQAAKAQPIFQNCFRDAILQLNRMMAQITELAENDFWAVNSRYKGVDKK